jgi:hypothetical protein
LLLLLPLSDGSAFAKKKSSGSKRVKSTAQNPGRLNQLRSRVTAGHKKFASKVRRNGRRVSKKLGLNKTVLEFYGLLGTGVPGVAMARISPKLVFSGKDTGNPSAFLATAKGVSAQALLFTAGAAHISKVERPLAFNVGLGPFSYRPYDPVHKSAYVGLQLPLIGDILIGPKMAGFSLVSSIPFAPALSAGAGVYMSGPLLEPVTGRLWKGGLWAGKQIQKHGQAFAENHPRAAEAARAGGRAMGRVVSRGKKLAGKTVRRVAASQGVQQAKELAIDTHGRAKVLGAQAKDSFGKTRAGKELAKGRERCV